MAAELLLFGWGAIGTLRTFRHAHEALRAAPSTTALELSPFQRQLEHAAPSLAGRRARWSAWCASGCSSGR